MAGGQLLHDYEKRVEAEIAHYKEVFDGKLFQDVPPIWDKVEDHMSDAIEDAVGVRSLYEYVARFAKGKKEIRLLGLGSGACGNELEGIAPLLKKQGTTMYLVGADINGEILDQAAHEAKKRKIPYESMVVDANTMTLEKESFDVIVCYASLHHFLDLDHSVAQINKALKKDGILVTVDIPTRNGYMMWDDTYEIVRTIWKTLPDQFKIDHTGYAQPTFVADYPNTNYAKTSFECINSEAVIPALQAGMKEICFVPIFTICRRFFDTKFGPNYDLRRPLDKAIFDYIMALDDYYLHNGILQPETFFGVYAKSNQKRKSLSSRPPMSSNSSNIKDHLARIMQGLVRTS